MKIIFSIITFLLFGVEILSAQYVNHKNIENEANTYIKVWTSEIFLARGRQIQVDYGQDIDLENNRKSFLKDENGQRMRFYSSIQIMNYFNNLGFEYLNYCQPKSDDKCWIFKRKE